MILGESQQWIIVKVAGQFTHKWTVLNEGVQTKKVDTGQSSSSDPSIYNSLELFTSGYTVHFPSIDRPFSGLWSWRHINGMSLHT